jgi:HAD superfamily hydrolase (TIGR01549 family)
MASTRGYTYPTTRLPAGIKLILFDLHGTLCSCVPSMHQSLLAFAQDLGYSVAPKAERAGLLWSKAYWASTDRWLDPADMNRSFSVSYIRQYLAAMGVPEDQFDEMVSSICDKFTHDYAPRLALAPGAKQLLWDLREQQYQLGLLSNQREPLTGIAIELEIIEYFDFTLAAGQVGSRKPAPLIFQQAIMMAEVQPQEAVYVGDNYYSDGIGAQRAELFPVLLDEQAVFAEIARDCWTVRQLVDLPALLPASE